MIMKIIFARFASLVSVFILSAVVSALMAAHLAAPQTLLNRCQSNCATELKRCLGQAGNTESRRQQCYERNRKCLNRCELVASPGE